MQSKPSKGITIAYSVVLGALAVLAAASYFNLDELRTSEVNAAVRLGMAAEQRTLVQRISLLAEHLIHIDHAFERTRTADAAVGAIDELIATHRALVEGDETRGLQPEQSPRALALFFGPDANLDKELRAFTERTRRFIDDHRASNDGDHSEEDVVHHTTSTSLMGDLGRLVSAYEADSAERNQTLHQRALMFTTLTMLFLLVSAFAVFRPLVRRADREASSLRGLQRRLRNILYSTPDALVTFRSTGEVIEFNPAAQRLFGKERDEVVGKNIVEALTHTSKHTEHIEAFEAMHAGADAELPTHRPFTITRPDGTEFPAEITVVKSFDNGDQLYTAFIADISDRLAHESQARMSQSVFNAVTQAIVVTNADNRIEAVNPAFTRITGYRPEEVVGRTPRMLKSGRHETEFYREMWESLHRLGMWSGEIWNRRKNGEIYPEWLAISTVRNDEGHIERHIGVFVDLTERKEVERHIWRQANYDTVTSLPNRNLFFDRLSENMTQAISDGGQIALLFIDLDNFKWVNETLGHAAGDELLRQASDRLRSCVRQTDTVARLGSDEFTVVITDIRAPGDAEAVAKKIIDTLREPFSIADEEAFVSASVGITLCPADGTTEEALLKNADYAMFKAKQSGRGSYRFYTRQMDEEARDRLELETDLRHAVSREELELHFQPIVGLSDGRVVGAEALLRWRHPERGLVPPVRFIPLAEETGLIMEIGDWVLRRSCQQARTWREAGFDIPISVNLSVKQFSGKRLVPFIADLLSEMDLPTEAIHLEITESILMRDEKHSQSILEALREMGLPLVIDDFGTGYSSLSYLKRFPVSELKIDRSFVSDLSSNNDDAVLVQAILGMAHNLQLGVVAEGIETLEQLEFLRSKACERGQGYYFAKPMPVEDFEIYMQREREALGA